MGPTRSDPFRRLDRLRIITERDSDYADYWCHGCAAARPQTRSTSFAAGYRAAKGEGPTPYHGYFFKVLTSQGPNAASGAADFIVKGRMIGGFGLVAWPARLGDSGIMTFIVNQDGVVAVGRDRRSW